MSLVLNKNNYKEYLYKTYSAWLGKNIGIRLGAPVENWTHEQIIKTYGDKVGYLVDYDIFAADDDSNGPLFFVRALLEKNRITAEDVGNAFLNYIQEYKGFFWWGGVGVSSEHTAYENLKNGIKAPQSGSKETNGIVMAEQIGGQIFSDCWGYVCGYDVNLAKDLAVKAASVTHDENGIEGAIFVSTAIALAYQRDNIHTVIDEALSYLDKDKEYYKVAKDIVDYYKGHTKEECYQYILDNYDYDKYPGTCHIIPNMALMVMAMKYGEGNFTDTLVMLNRCGRDTDCNCGNVGSILGALNGVDNIDEMWIKPINDIVNSSSCLGSENIDTISNSAKAFTLIALKLKGQQMPSQKLFNLPYGTNGFRVSEGETEVRDDVLVVRSKGDLYKYVYYLPKDIYDARYDPAFSPTLYPGSQIEFVVRSHSQTTLSFMIEDCEGNIHYSDNYVVKEEIGLLTGLPYDKNMVINRIGLHFVSGDPEYYLSEVNIDNWPYIEADFRNYPVDGYGPRYAGDTLYNIRAFNEHSGSWTVTEEGLVAEANDHGLISTGSLDSRYHGIYMSFIPRVGKNFELVFNMNGYLDYSSIGFEDDHLVYKIKNRTEKIIKKVPFVLEKDKEYLLKYYNGVISVDNEELIKKEIKLNKLTGMKLGNNSKALIKQFKTW